MPAKIKPSGQRKSSIKVREMSVNDIPAVYRLGHRLFRTHGESTFYRTWDAYEVTNNFNQDPRLTLVAQSFRRMGYGKPEAEVWMSKVIQRTRKNRERIASSPRKRRIKATRRKRQSRQRET